MNMHWFQSKCQMILFTTSNCLQLFDKYLDKLAFETGYYFSNTRNNLGSTL